MNVVRLGKRRRQWLVVGIGTLTILLLLWSSTIYHCPDDDQAVKRFLAAQITSEQWDDAILLGGVPRQERVYLTIGIPTVRRNNGSYIIKTVQSLINQTSSRERDNMSIVISVNDNNAKYTNDLMAQLKKEFGTFLKSGTLLVIRAPNSYYPSLRNLVSTFGDDQSRVRWRSKQNLDYAFLIHYSQNLSNNYLQLEDDVIAAPDYVTKMTSYVQELKEQWTMIDFSEMGFIGKMYKNKDLPKLAKLLRTFYNEQPCDFLLLHFLNLMLQKKRFIRIPTLFKHMGIHSSLRNVTRNNVNVYFEEKTKIYKGDNPQAVLKTTIRVFGDNVLENAYNNSRTHGFFWGKDVVSGDVISVLFKTPQNISRIVLASGLNADKKRDHIHDAILEYGTYGSGGKCYAEKKVGALETFDYDYSEGLLINVHCLKITITNDYTQWLVIRELAIFTQK